MARLAMRVKAARKPKYMTRKHNRCPLCGRPRAYIRDYDMCRLCFRKLASNGMIPGVVKASW
ncbi:MAG: type Z 30S ribosomal protein S14 [Spirochaetes bacterium]|nr:type Z 30S ribosomal protein S14 [Spirochaetota bacterium]